MVNLDRILKMAKGGLSPMGTEVVCEIKQSQPTVIRVVDSIGDIVVCGVSWIESVVNGTKKNMPFKVYREYDDGNKTVTERNILGELIQFMSTKTKVIGEDNKTHYIPKYKEQWPEIYDEMFPESDGNDSMLSNFQPSPCIYLNVIDRTDNWCEQNKHTKLLGKNQKTKYIGPKIIESLISKQKTNGDYREYDLVVYKEGMKLNTKYTCENIMKPDMYPTIYVNGRLPTTPLTEEEDNYSLYDTHFLTKLTSASVILDRIGETIRRIDSIIGGDYYNRLMIEREHENKVKAQNGSTVQEQPAVQPQVQSGSQSTQAPKSNVEKFNDIRKNMSAGNTPAQTQSTVSPVVPDKKDKIFCVNCGTLIPANAVFCSGCGTKQS